MLKAPFYCTPAGGPYYNMAFDEWLFSRVLGHPGSIYLRLYSWQPGTITFGYNQHRETALDFRQLEGTPVVRRITGGRALYHDPSELTYSIAVNADGLSVPALSGSLSRTSESIARALAAFLESLSIGTEYVRQSSPTDMQPEYFHKAPCFASAARYELMADGRKIAASAQKRLGSSLLQHGSIKIHGIVSHPALAGVDGYVDTNPQAVDSKALKEMCQLFHQSMGRVLGVEFRPCELTAGEADKVRAHTAYVEKNALNKRVIVAQIDDAASL